MAPVTVVQSVPVGHAHYMGLSGTALRTAIGLTAGLCFVAFGYGQGACVGELEAHPFANRRSLTVIRFCLLGDLGGLMTMQAFQHEFGQMFKSGAIAGSVIATCKRTDVYHSP